MYAFASTVINFACLLILNISGWTYRYSSLNHIDGVMVNVIASSAVDRGFDNINKYEIRRQSRDRHGIHVVAKHKSIHIWLFTPTDANATNKVSSNRPKSDRSLS